MRLSHISQITIKTRLQCSEITGNTQNSKDLVNKMKNTQSTNTFSGTSGPIVRIWKIQNHYEAFWNTQTHSKQPAGTQNIQKRFKLTQRLSGTPKGTQGILQPPRTLSWHFRQAGDSHDHFQLLGSTGRYQTYQGVLRTTCKISGLYRHNDDIQTCIQNTKWSSG